MFGLLPCFWGLFCYDVLLRLGGFQQCIDSAVGSVYLLLLRRLCVSFSSPLLLLARPPPAPRPPSLLLCSCGLRSSSSALLPPACPPRPVCLACLPSPLLPLVASLLSGLWTGEGHKAESEGIRGDPLRPVVPQGLTRRRPPPCASSSRCCQSRHTPRWSAADDQVYVPHRAWSRARSPLCFRPLSVLLATYLSFLVWLPSLLVLMMRACRFAPFARHIPLLCCPSLHFGPPALPSLFVRRGGVAFALQRPCLRGPLCPALPPMRWRCSSRQSQVELRCLPPPRLRGWL